MPWLGRTRPDQAGIMKLRGIVSLLANDGTRHPQLLARPIELNIFENQRAILFSLLA
jgi:hypothetical protein